MWRLKAREIGCDARRTAANVVTPDKRYNATCKGCSKSYGRGKRPQAGAVYRCACRRGDTTLVWVDSALIKI